jgi:citrate lyase subunit beta/citryl-CoA lyase
MIAVPDWQTLLFVPVGADRHLASAIRHRPDAIILDLEDAVAASAKAEARRGLAAAQAAVAKAGIACVVRVNAPLSLMVEDIAALDRKAVSALLLPKVEDSRIIDNAAELTGGSIGLVALIESPLGVQRLPRLGRHVHLVGLMLGSEDYSASLGVHPDGGALTHVAAQIAIAAAPRGLLPIGFPGSIANFRDLDLYARQIAEGRNLGMRAVAAIHPAQLPAIRASLRPTENEVAWAKSIMDFADRQGGDTKAVTAIDGVMVDAPVIARARNILRRTD